MGHSRHNACVLPAAHRAQVRRGSACQLCHYRSAPLVAPLPPPHALVARATISAKTSRDQGLSPRPTGRAAAWARAASPRRRRKPSKPWRPERRPAPPGPAAAPSASPSLQTARPGRIPAENGRRRLRRVGRQRQGSSARARQLWRAHLARVVQGCAADGARTAVRATPKAAAEAAGAAKAARLHHRRLRHRIGARGDRGDRLGTRGRLRVLRLEIVAEVGKQLRAAILDRLADVLDIRALVGQLVEGFAIPAWHGFQGSRGPLSTRARREGKPAVQGARIEVV